MTMWVLMSRDWADGNGTVDAASTDNIVSDESGLEAVQELELDTLAPPVT
jgi:hypothetical protein